jgi:hypothetical protein
MANVISADGTNYKHYLHSGFSSSISDSYSSPSTAPRGITWDSSNTISADSGTDAHYLHSGFSDTISDSYSSPSGTPFGITWDGFNVISADPGTNKHYRHVGFSSSLYDSYSSPSGTPNGIAWDGLNVISADNTAASEKHYLHSRFSSSISDSYSSPNGTPTGITWDSTNVISSDATADVHYLHSGFSDTISDSYSGLGQPTGITWDGTRWRTPGAEGFPQVAAYNSSNESSNTTTHTVSLPADISAGNLLLIFFATDGDISVSNWNGFTEIFSVDNGTDNSLSVAYKIASGSEGATVDITTNESEHSAHISWRITGHNTSQMPEASTGATNPSANVNPDPDSLTPTGGAKNYLYIAVEGNDDDDVTYDWPLVFYKQTESATGCTVGVCADELNQASLDPGTFTIAAAETWVACTVAVHPAAAAAVEGSATANAVSSSSSAGARILKGSSLAKAASGQRYRQRGKFQQFRWR